MRKIFLALLVTAALSFLIAYSAIAQETGSDDSNAATPHEKVADRAAKTATENAHSALPAKEKVTARQEKRAAAANTELKEKTRERVKDEKLVAVTERKATIKERAGNRELLKKESFAKVRETGKARLEKLNSEKLEKVASLRAEHVEKFAMLDRSRMKELAQLNKTEIEAKLKKIRVVEADEGFRFRPLTIEQAQRSERAFEQLKENEGKLREKYNERMEKINEVKERVKECKENPENEACADVNEEAVERSKEAALEAVERVKNHLEKIRERIGSSQDLTEEEAADRIAKIDAILAEVESIKAEIDAATAKEGLNAAIGKLKAIVKRIKSSSEEHTHNIIKAQIMGAIHRMGVTEKKADCSLGSLEDEGTDTTSIDAKIDEYASLITAAREKIKEAKETFNAEDKEAVESARALVKEARDLVKQAKEKLDEIRKDVRELGGEICTEKQEIAIEEDDE